VSVQFGIITSVVPPGSWHYPQTLSSGQIHRITGFSFEELLANMLEFRTRHLDLCGGNQSATIDAVRVDLKRYICAHFKGNCADSPGPPPASQPIVHRTTYVRPLDKAANWLAKRAQARIDLVDLGIATHRAEACVGCQQNIRWETGCSSCNDNVSIRVQHLKGTRHTQFDSRLFACRVFGHVNSVAVWLTDTQSTPEQAPPAHCWHLTENGK
jgi:hypothetical protein